LKKISSYCLSIFITTAAVLLAGCQKSSSASQICFQSHCFDVEVVSSGPAKQRGLQFRESLAQNVGMLFVFGEEKKHAFWMKDTLIPLDMIWMNYNHEIVYALSHVPPCTGDPCPVYTPANNALYVLEINAGLIDKIGLKENDRAEFHFNSEK
jgi:uncharacterized membrane protein (UPF0127 family)